MVFEPIPLSASFAYGSGFTGCFAMVVRLLSPVGSPRRSMWVGFGRLGESRFYQMRTRGRRVRGITSRNPFHDRFHAVAARSLGKLEHDLAPDRFSEERTRQRRAIG